MHRFRVQFWRVLDDGSESLIGEAIHADGDGHHDPMAAIQAAYRSFQTRLTIDPAQRLNIRVWAVDQDGSPAHRGEAQ